MIITKLGYPVYKVEYSLRDGTGEIIGWKEYEPDISMNEYLNLSADHPGDWRLREQWYTDSDGREHFSLEPASTKNWEEHWRNNPKIYGWNQDPSYCDAHNDSRDRCGCEIIPKTKPYTVVVELQAEDLEAAVAIAKSYDPGKVVSVIQKYRMTNVGTEWHNPEVKP